MLKLKTILLGSVVSSSLLTMGTFAHADEYQNQNQDQNQSNQPQLPKPSFYAEVGGGWGLSNMFDATVKDTDTKITIGNAGGFSGGIGGHIGGGSVGLEVSAFDSDVDLQDSILGNDKETIGDFSTLVSMVKLTPEHVFGNHVGIYGTFGLGLAVYDIEDKKENVRYSPVYIAPAIMVGAGLKLYLGQQKGLYVTIGARYTKIIHKDLTINMVGGDMVLTGGLGFGQGMIKLGYQF